MPNFINLPPFTEDGDVHVVVETPRGSRAKFAYDPKLETFILSKSLLTGLTYPHDWGFVPSTKADDGDPIDIMVIHDAATFPGMVLTCRIIGILQIEQKSKGNGWAERPPVRSTPALALGAGPARCSGHLKADSGRA
jgi:inorganic pyrophosphatase